MDPQGDPLTTRRTQMGWEITMELYPSGQLRLIDDPDRQFGNGSVYIRIQTRSDRPELLLTLSSSQGVLIPTHISNNPSVRLKHSGVPDGSDRSDGTLFYLMED